MVQLRVPETEVSKDICVGKLPRVWCHSPECRSIRMGGSSGTGLRGQESEESFHAEQGIAGAMEAGLHMGKVIK